MIMNKEKEHIHKHKIEFSHLDENSYIKPDGYQHIIAQVIDEHLALFDIDFDLCLENNYSWVLVALNVKIAKHVKGCANLFIQTWFSERKRVHFRREFEARDDKGEVVFVASIYSILIDLKTHAIYRKKELPFTLMEANPEFLLESSPSFQKEELEYVFADERTIRRSYIDALGHVNNCRYGEFAFDALSDNEADLSKINAFDLYFLSELKLNETLMLEKTQEKNISIHGYNKSTQKTSFYCVFHR